MSFVPLTSHVQCTATSPLYIIQIRIDTNNSLAVHVKETLHDISWENVKLLQEEQHKIRRKIKEAILIQKTPCMKMDLGMNVDPIRKDILN